MKAPELIEIEKVVPTPGLGKNFDRALYPQLGVSTKSQIWGDKSGATMEPQNRDFKNEIRAKVLESAKYRCHYCGFYSSGNEVTNLNDNHQDISLTNLRAIDFLCHAWKHLGELPPGKACLAYLPGLSPQDINHFQRTIAVALLSKDEATRTDAKDLLNWLASHREYVKNAWGTYDPGVFATALRKLDQQVSTGSGDFVFDGLSVILSPETYKKNASYWAKEGYVSYPSHEWGHVYHQIMNAPI